MEHLFGPAWPRQGGLSLYFLTPTMDGEPVQAFARRLADGADGASRAAVWMEDAQGARVCEGTASLGGPDPDSELTRRLAGVRPAAELRLLSASRVGDAARDVPVRLKLEAIAPRLEAITEPMPAYRDASVYGEIVAAPVAAIEALRAVEKSLFRPTSPYVGLFGAIELQLLNGPIFVEHDYRADGRVLALSDSPKTEMIWYESTLREPEDGRPVARMIMLSRALKASSALWS
jgi:hypothetical protein